MKKFIVATFCAALLFTGMSMTGCSKKKECVSKCEKAVKDAEAKCPKGDAGKTCKETLKKSHEACKKACDKA